MWEFFTSKVTQSETKRSVLEFETEHRSLGCLCKYSDIRSVLRLVTSYKYSHIRPVLSDLLQNTSNRLVRILNFDEKGLLYILSVKYNKHRCMT